MATNADTEVEESQETETQADEQLRQDLKESLANDTKTEAAETDKETNSEAAEAESKDDATLTKEVPVEPEKDLDWYKKAYEESTKEALRLKSELDKAPETPPPPVVTTPEAEKALTPEQLYIRQKQNEEITEAFSEISAKYPSLKERETYDRFVAEANTIGRVIVENEKRFPSPKELYSKAAVILGLTPDNSEELGAAIKVGAETTKTSSATSSLPPKSKVTEEMIAMNIKMFPAKTRAEIIEELEPYIQ